MKEFMYNFKRFNRFDRFILGLMIGLDVILLVSSAFGVASFIKKHESAMATFIFSMVSVAAITFFILVDMALCTIMKKEADRKANEEAI